MKMLDLGKLYTTQVSLTEWFVNIKHAKANTLKEEDNAKRDRLEILYREIGVPYDKPIQFTAVNLANNDKEFVDFFINHKNDLCALRLIPNKSGLPKLRLRGITVEKAMEWFWQQGINPLDYKADFVPHEDKYNWATIFVVNKHGIFGEVIKGGHYQLTQGFYDAGKPITFSYNFKKLILSKKNLILEKYLKNIFKYILVKDIKKQALLKKSLKAKFFQNYLGGYFETVDSKASGIWFCDYNRILGNIYSNFSSTSSKIKSTKFVISGHTASHGNVKGKVRIIDSVKIQSETIEKNEILVCTMTSPDFLPLMKKALAIVTDYGGVLSHAAIISRELKIPCIVGTQKATKVLKTGDYIEIDSQRGCITKLTI